MEAEREVFLHGNKEAFESGKDEKYAPGCVANGIPESVAEEIWNRMANFASYAFNRSHAACYAWIANITAYMACHWPEYFFAAMMNAFVEISDKFKGYLVEAVTRGIKILPPDINRSGCMFTVDREAGGIRFGLRGLTGMNKLAEKIIEEREKNGEFTDVEDFYNRMANGGNKPSSAHLTSLANSGAFSAFGANRRSTLALCERIASSYGKTQKYALEGQVSMFDLGMDSKKVDVPELDEYSIQDLLENEFKALGVYLTDHPARLVYDEVAGVFNTKPLRIHELLARDNGTKAICIGQIKQFKRKYTKNGDIMLQFELHDQYQSVKAVVFPKNVTAAEPFLVEGAVIGAKGRFAKDENFGDQLVVDCVYNVDGMRAMKPEVLIVTVTGKDSQEQLKQLSDRFPGKTPIALRAKGSGRIYRTRWTANMNSLVFVDKLANTWDYEVAKI